jgi:hypothetical protein
VDFASLIASRTARREALNARREALGSEGQSILDAAAADGARALTETEDARGLAIAEERGSLRSQIEALDAEIATFRSEQAADARATEDAQRTQRTSAPVPAARVTSEARTYAPETDKRGVNFATDVARQFLFGDIEARDRLSRHMQEERVERGGLIERAAGTSAFSGLVIPQYLVDQFAPLARAGRPFADVTRHHDLPEVGMTVSLGKVTTGTSVDNQSAENAAVSETDIDDTLLTINVKTAAGSQTLSRQASERGVGVEDTTIEDLIRAYHVNLDSKLLNEAVTGLSAVATAIAYTDATPTAAELYPKLLAAPAAVEAALLDQAVGDVVAVMHSRRWYWLQSQLTSTWPLFGQPGVQAQQGGANFGATYGAGFRGVLPNGTPVIVDNNIGTSFGTNEDEIYFVSRTEAHLWEDPNAPVLIRAEQPKAKQLGIDLVVYGYFAYTFQRRAHAQKINGTGLILPTF